MIKEILRINTLRIGYVSLWNTPMKYIGLDRWNHLEYVRNMSILTVAISVWSRFKFFYFNCKTWEALDLQLGRGARDLWICLYKLLKLSENNAKHFMKLQSETCLLLVLANLGNLQFSVDIFLFLRIHANISRIPGG